MARLIDNGSLAATQRLRGTEEILRIARGQHGVVARWQLLSIRFSGSSIDRRIASRQLLPVFSGVYAVGSDVLSQKGSWMAGVLAGGPGSVLSHRTAGALWGIIDAGPRVEATRAFGIEPVAGLAPGCRIPGLRIRRTRSLPASEKLLRTGIPVMSLERTLLSLASVLTLRRLESAYAAARRTGELNPAALDRTLARGPGWKGIGMLRRLVRQSGDLEPRSKSVLEDCFLALCQQAGIPKPKVNSIVEGIEVDCCWPNERLIVELDGFQYHSDPASFARDRSRDASLVLGGYRVLRFTFQQVTEDQMRVIETVTRLLDRTDPGDWSRSSPPVRGRS